MSYVGGEAAHGVEARNDQNGRNVHEPTTSFPQPIGMSASWGYRAYKEGREKSLEQRQEYCGIVIRLVD